VSSTATTTRELPWVFDHAPLTLMPKVPVSPHRVPFVNAVSVGVDFTNSAGVVTTIEVGLVDMIVAAALPKVTFVMAPRFVPVMVTVVPPTDGPDVALSELIVGARAVARTAVDVAPMDTVLPCDAGVTT